MTHNQDQQVPLVPLTLDELNVLCYALNSMVMAKGFPDAQHAVPMWQKLMAVRKQIMEPIPNATPAASV